MLTLLPCQAMAAVNWIMSPKTNRLFWSKRLSGHIIDSIGSLPWAEDSGIQAAETLHIIIQTWFVRYAIWI